MRQLIVLLVLAIFAGMLASCTSQPARPVTTPEPKGHWRAPLERMPGAAIGPSIPASGFGFVLRYGYGERDAVDTLRGTVTKDLYTAGQATADLRLTEQELEAVRLKLEEIALLGYPEAFEPRGVKGSFVPAQSYEIHVVWDGGDKTVRWAGGSITDDPRLKELLDLVDVIDRIVRGRPEYQALPPREGGVA